MMIALSCYNFFLFKGDIVNVVGTTTVEGVLLPIVRSEWDGTLYIAYGVG